MPVQPGRTSVRLPTAPPRRPLPSDPRPETGQEPPGEEPSGDGAATGRR